MKSMLDRKGWVNEIWFMKLTVEDFLRIWDEKEQQVKDRNCSDCESEISSLKELRDKFFSVRNLVNSKLKYSQYKSLLTSAEAPFVLEHLRNTCVFDCYAKKLLGAVLDGILLNIKSNYDSKLNEFECLLLKHGSEISNGMSYDRQKEIRKLYKAECGILAEKEILEAIALKPTEPEMPSKAPKRL